MNIFRLIKIPDLVTLSGVVFAVLSIFFSIQGNFFLSSVLILASVIADKIDGSLARLMKRKGDFGRELDSLADAISFGAAPAVFGYMILEKSIFSYFVLILFVCAGILRLARFNISEKNGYFEGLPITASGIIIPGFFLLKLPIAFFPYLFLILSVLMISSFRIKKLGV